MLLSSRIVEIVETFHTLRGVIPTPFSPIGTLERMGRDEGSDKMRRVLTAGVAALALALAACSAPTLVSGTPSPAGTAPASAAPFKPAKPVKPAPKVAPKPAPKPAPAKTAPPVATKAVVNMCATNTHAQFVLVDIAQQHAWMCAGTKQVYNTPVTTGATVNGDDTPTGTWRVQGKQGARYLTVRGGASYHVNYWMPYDGDYGFHDAAWQTFPEGTSQYHTDGSHGCVHLPMAAMAWLYRWAQVGTTVTVRA
jgi:lipoprotein-anchoring transpeptidase ErfK/SrfK